LVEFNSLFLFHDFTSVFL